MSFDHTSSSKESYVRPRRLAVFFNRSGRARVESRQDHTNHLSSHRSQGTGAFARRSGRRLALLAAGLGVSASLMAFALPTAAQAASPWWHLSSGTRPTYIDPDAGEPGIPGEPEIQEIVARFISEEEVGAFATEPAALRGFGAPA